MSGFCRLVCVSACLLYLPAQAQAQTDGGTFDVLLRGIRTATLSFAASLDGDTYTVTGQMQTSGLAALIKRLRYDGAATGTIAEGRYRPARYAESADTGRRQSEATLTYANGAPHVTAYSPLLAPQPGDVDPAAMAGSVDPMTALFATLRAVDAGAECNLSLDLFDGKRASQLRVGEPVVAADRVTCDGAYVRVQGFTAKEMAKQSRFPFTLTYAPTANGQMQVVEVISESIYGKVTLKRR